MLGNDFLKNDIHRKEQEYKNTEHLTVKNVFRILSVWLYTDYHKKLISDWASFTSEAKILLSLSDVPFFASQVENEMRISDWQNLLQILFKEKISKEDILWIISWSKSNEKHLPLIARAIYTYDLFSFNSGPYQEFTAYATNDNCVRFIYLFINEPKHFSILNEFINHNKYISDTGSAITIYMKAHFFRAALFHFSLKNDTEKIDELTKRMPLEVNYYFTGSPKKFINDSIKWAKQ